MADAKRTKNGKYTVLVYIGTDSNGKKKYKRFTDKDKIRCERMASEYADEHRDICDPVSFQSAINDYLALRKAVLSPSTYRGYKAIDNYLKTHYRAFYERSVYDMDANVVQALINDMVLNDASPKSVSNRVGLISAVLKQKNVSMPNVKLPEKKKPDYRVPDTDQVKKILDKAKGKDMEIPILLAAYGGMRRSEICALTIDDITGDTIRINKAVVMNEDHKPVAKTTKTYESTRDVPMAHEIIQKILKKGYITDADNPEEISQRFTRIVDSVGCHGTRFHDLRHFHASWLHAKGIPDQYIMERMGWKTDTAMKKFYRHALASEEDNVNKRINADISKLLGH